MPGLFDGGNTGDGAEKLCRFCGVISAASTAATYVVAKSGNDELKKQMRLHYSDRGKRTARAKVVKGM